MTTSAPFAAKTRPNLGATPITSNNCGSAAHATTRRGSPLSGVRLTSIHLSIASLSNDLLSRCHIRASPGEISDRRPGSSEFRRYAIASFA
jgi:hypothetical protein